MTDDMRLLLRILLEQELREAEPEMQRPRKKREAEREDGIDYAPAESREKTKRTKDTMKEERAEDLQQARSDMYSTHENVAYNMKKVPIWEKYALSLSEAVEAVSAIAVVAKLIAVTIASSNAIAFFIV